jgi:hypothetical protein
MSRASFFSAVLLSFLVVSWVAPGAEAGLRFADPTKDAGEVRRGPVLAHHFAFVNEGPNAVVITEGRASCGCLTPRFSAKLLKPGDEGWLELEVNTLSQPAGPNSWRVQVFYRDGDESRETAVQLSAQLVAEIDVQPASLSILCGEQARTCEIVVTDKRPKPLTVTSSSASSPKLRTDLHKADKGTHKIGVEVAADYPEGRHDDVVSIYTDDPAYREIRVPVTVVKRGRQRLSAAPEQVKFEGPAGQPLPSRIVLLRDADNQAVIVDQATADDPALICRWAAGPQTMSTLKVLVDSSRLNGRTSVRSTIRVELKEPVPQTMTIPVEVTLK